MALAPLASVADLSARGISILDEDAALALLDAASAAVREAAGAVITEHEATVTIEGTPHHWLRLPGWAVTDVSDVSIDDAAVTDFRLVGGRLWRSCGWQSDCGPSLVTFTYTQGLAEAPADIVDLVCALVAAGLASTGDGFDPHRGVSSVRIDDYQVSYTRGADEVVSVMEIPERTRLSLASRFGSASAVTGSY